ncbi:MAG: penicillin-binding protein 2, partial [Arachnia sp.]
MNRPLRHVSILVAFMMAALLANITWISVVRTDSLNADQHNRRVRDAQFSQNRGTILVGNTAVAESDRTQNSGV